MDCYHRRLKSTKVPTIGTPIFKSCLKDVIVCHPRSKRDKLMEFFETGGDTIVTNKMAFSTLGVGMMVAILFIVSFMPGDDTFAPTKVQAQEVVEQMETATMNMDSQQRLALEHQLKMSLEQMLIQIKAADNRAVYDLDPRVPMHITDNRSGDHATFLISFHQDNQGRLTHSTIIKKYHTGEGSASAFGRRRVFQYASQDGQVVLLELSESNAPKSGIILARN